MARNWAPPSEEEFLAQIAAADERGRMAAREEARARSARYHAQSGWTFVELTNGCIFAFPPDLEEVRDLSPEERARVRVLPGGRVLAWDDTEVDLSIPGLLGRDSCSDFAHGAHAATARERHSA